MSKLAKLLQPTKSFCINGVTPEVMRDKFNVTVSPDFVGMKDTGKYRLHIRKYDDNSNYIRDLLDNMKIKSKRSDDGSFYILSRSKMQELCGYISEGYYVDDYDDFFKYGGKNGILRKHGDPFPLTYRVSKLARHLSTNMLAYLDETGKLMDSVEVKFNLYRHRVSDILDCFDNFTKAGYKIDALPLDFFEMAKLPEDDQVYSIMVHDTPETDKFDVNSEVVDDD